MDINTSLRVKVFISADLELLAEKLVICFSAAINHVQKKGLV